VRTTTRSPCRRSPSTRSEGDIAISRFTDLRVDAEKAGQVVRARIALRRCDEVGALTRVRGRIAVRNSGLIRIGSRVRMWADPTPIELSTLPGGELVIGDGTSINRGVCLCARAAVHIGRNCGIGNDVLVVDSDFHEVGHHSELRADVPAAVVIGDSVWLAARSVVLKGVTIGEGAVVCAGSVVVTSVPPYTMVGGSPARAIRRLTPAEGAPWPASEAGTPAAAAVGAGRNRD
jgi:acetyltransferase-like isoleucine patch superfamily enzyme